MVPLMMFSLGILSVIIPYQISHKQKIFYFLRNRKYIYKANLDSSNMQISVLEKF